MLLWKRSQFSGFWQRKGERDPTNLVDLQTPFPAVVAVVVKMQAIVDLHFLATEMDMVCQATLLLANL